MTPPLYRAYFALLLALIIPGLVTAYPYNEEFGNPDYSIGITYNKISGYGNVPPYRPLDTVKIAGISKGKTLSTETQSHVDTSYQYGSYLYLDDRSITSRTVPATLEYNGQTYGSGELSYFYDPDTKMLSVILDINNFYYDATDTQTFYLRYNRDDFNNLKFRYLSGGVTMPEIGACLWGGAYACNAKSTVLLPPWQQTLTITDYSSTHDKITLTRNGLESRITVATDTKVYANKVKGINTYSINLPKVQRPYYVTVDRHGQTHDFVFFDTDNPVGPSDLEFSLAPLPPSSGQPVTATLTGSTDDVGLIIYTFGDAEYYSTDGAAGDGELGRFKRIDGAWMQADEGGDYTIPVADPTSYQFTGPGHVGQYKFAGLAKDADGAILKYQDIFTTVGSPHGYEFVVPLSGRPGYGILAWLDCSDAALDAADLVFYTLGDPEWYKTNHARGDGSWTGFKRINGAWYEYNQETSEFTIPVTSPREYKFPPPTHPDIYKFLGTVKTTRGDILHDQETEIVVSGPDDRATLTVYVKRSDTGALIDGATVVVTGAGREIARGPAPGGIATISLPKTGNVEYWLSVSAPGYTQTMPQLFGIMQDISITVEMAPETPPPADPHNVHLQFNIRDYNQNPIDAATIEVSGTVRTTNAAGFARFEVPKNATHQYTVWKTGYLTVTGAVATGAQSPVNVQVTLYSGVVPTQTAPGSSDTPGPGDDPGATPPPGPTPDRRTNEEKGQAVIDMVADNAEGIGALALICLLMGLLKLMVKW
jgi:hypothetical protein